MSKEESVRWEKSQVQCRKAGPMKVEAMSLKDAESTKQENRLLVVMPLICCDLRQVTVTLFLNFLISDANRLHWFFKDRFQGYSQEKYL